MLSFHSGALVVAFLLAGTSDAAEPPTAVRCPQALRIDLDPEPSDPAPDVCVSADEPTTFVFDTRVELRAVEFQPEGRFSDVGLGREGLSLTVIPKPGFLPDERVRLTVRYADGTLPTSAGFWLVGHASRGTRRVEVYRQPRPADAFKREAAEARAEASQCREEKAQLVAERSEPGGLMGAAWLEQLGTVASRGLRKVTSPPGNALVLVDGMAYSYTRIGGTQAISLSVRLLLSNPSAKPWTTAGAALLDSSGEQVDLSAFQATPIQASSEGAVVVGTEREPGQFACPCTLKLWEASGSRVVTLGNIRFPEAPKPGG